MANCTTHNLLPARMHCVDCGHFLCDMCLRSVEVNRQEIFICAKCGGRATEIYGTPVSTAGGIAGSFWSEIIKILLYPLRSTGLATIILGTFFFILMGVLNIFPVFSLIVAILLAGYLLKFYETVVQTSAKGEKNPPSWSDIDFFDFGELIRTFFRTFGVILFTFSPPFIYIWMTGNFNKTVVYLFAFSVFFFPMAFLAVSWCGSIVALNPVTLLRSISRTFIHYVVVVIMFYLLISLDWGLMVLLGISRTFMNPLGHLAVYIILHRFISLYLFTSLMHLLGMFYYFNQHRLGWH